MADSPTRIPDERPGGAPRGGRRPYSTPRLTEYGSVAKLTKGAGSYATDGGRGGFSMTKST